MNQKIIYFHSSVGDHIVSLVRDQGTVLEIFSSRQRFTNLSQDTHKQVGNKGKEDLAFLVFKQSILSIYVWNKKGWVRHYAEEFPKGLN